MPDDQHDTVGSPDDGIDVASTEAYVAVGILADALGDGSDTRALDSAREHLTDALAAAPPESEAADHAERALEHLADMGETPVGERERKMRDALAELAPLAASLTDRDRHPAMYALPETSKPTVPVFYHIPGRVADRAVARWRRRQENDPDTDRTIHLREYLYDEIHEQAVIYVDGEPLGEYASTAGVETLADERGADD